MYKTSKTMLNKIRDDYGCKGEVVFKSALQCVVECGQQTFQDESWVTREFDKIEAKHKKMEEEGKISFISMDFEKAILECAIEIAKIPPMDLLQYVQKEIWLSGEGMDYQRAIELLIRCMGHIEDSENYNHTETLDVFYGVGFNDDEIEELGYGWLLEREEE